MSETDVTMPEGRKEGSRPLTIFRRSVSVEYSDGLKRVEQIDSRQMMNIFNHNILFLNFF